MSDGVVPPHQGVQYHLQVCVCAARHDQGLGKGYLIWRRQVGSVVQSRVPNLTCDELRLVNVVLQ